MLKIITFVIAKGYTYNIDPLPASLYNDSIPLIDWVTLLNLSSYHCRMELYEETAGSKLDITFILNIISDHYEFLITLFNS